MYFRDLKGWGLDMWGWGRYSGRGHSQNPHDAVIFTVAILAVL